ncbi:MAG TPA: M14 family metallopeptidase [Draconibacterium sp.]|nr:M14 family metallopeptidase [Draconibacterium sp.]
MSKNYILFFLFAVLLQINAKAQITSQQVQSPKEFFGFQPGDDRMLLNYESLTEYLKKLADTSPRVKMLEIGKTAMGKPMYLVLFSSPENINNIDQLKKINKELAINPNLSETQLSEYCSKGKVFIMATLSMHATEVGPSQAAALVAYKLATSTDADLLKQMEDVVYMMVPSSNPDGMDMVVKHYMDSKDTKYEGSSLPQVYNKYVGHDNNRDFVTLTQSANKAIARVYNTEWYPQVLVDKHQMGSTGARYFVPPNHDPIAENVDERIWNWSWIFGSNMAKDMTANGLMGVTQHSIFDNYWPGSTETGIWKNMISLLTECASVQLAKPIYIEKTELSGGSSGLAEYEKGINMPAPWEGGWWRLSDIVAYEMSSSFSLIKTGSFHKKDILRNRNVLCKAQVEKGKTLAPAYYVLPGKQHDESELIALLSLLHEHGIEVYKTTKELRYNDKIIEEGDYVVPLAQAYRPFIKEVMEKQEYPVRHFSKGGEIMRPYDITSWSLPLQQGIFSYQIDEVVAALDKRLSQVQFPFETDSPVSVDTKTLVFPVKNNESFKAVFAAMSKGIDISRVTKEFSSDDIKLEPGDFVISVNAKKTADLNQILSELTVEPLIYTKEITDNIKPLTLPGIALVETVFSDMDAGWTRYIFDTYHIPFTLLKPEEIKDDDLSKYDVIVFPSTNKSLLVDAKRKSRDGSYSIPNYDPKYLKGMEKEGVQKLMKYLNDGGTIISWGESTALFFGDQTIKTSDKKDAEKEEFELPVRDISSTIKGFYAPGSLFNVDLLPGHPLTLGMEKTARVFTEGSPVFATSIPYFDTDRRVIATYSEDEVLASGYAENQELIEGKPTMVWVRKGKGNLVLYGFSPQFRASTPGTYKLLFNSLLLNEEY